MEFFDVLEKRHSVRRFREKDIEEEKLQKLLGAICSAPSAGNRQAYEIVVVREKKHRQELAEACNGQKFVAKAPIVLVFLTNDERSVVTYGERGKEMYAMQDATIAASYAQLAAVELGLGSVWVGAFDDEKVAKVVGAGKGFRAAAVIPLGYPEGETFITGRRKLKEIVHEGSI